MFSVMNNACCDVLCNLFKKRSDIHNRLTHHANLNFCILPCCSKVRKDFIVKELMKKLIFLKMRALTYFD